MGALDGGTAVRRVADALDAAREATALAERRRERTLWAALSGFVVVAVVIAALCTVGYIKLQDFATARTADRYHASDALRDFNARDLQIIALRKRVADLEQEVRGAWKRR